MVRGKDDRFQEVSTVVGVFVLVCGGVLAVASSVPTPAEPPPPEVVEIQRHAEQVSVALEDGDYGRAKASIEAMCSEAESLERRSPSDPEREGGSSVTLAK